MKNSSNGSGLGWLDFLSNWRLVELDFQEFYSIDLGTPGLMRARSWRWLSLRLIGLLSMEGRVQRVLRPTEQPGLPGTN